MNKSSPLARAVRTFMYSAAGALTTISAAVLASDFAAAQTAAVIGLFTALGAAVLAVATYYTAIKSDTPLQRAVVTAAQFFLANAGTLAIAEATQEAVKGWGEALLRALVAALVTGAAAFGQNAAEG